MYPILNIYPAEVMIDEPVHIWVENLKPGEKITIEVNSDRFWSTPSSWYSKASFIASEKGIVNLKADKPVSGDYDEADMMGLFTHMKRMQMPFNPRQRKLTDVPRLHIERIKVVLRTEDGEILGTGNIKRHFVREDVHSRNVVSGDVVGRYYYPGRMNNPRPAIITLGGPDGKLELAQGYAALFASMGMPALALAYFNLENLPSRIQSVPLEYIEKAISWLRGQDQVDGQLIGVFGYCKGGEMALAAASLMQDIRFVIAHTPSAFVFQADGKGINNTKTSSWTYQGRELPYAEFQTSRVGFMLRRAVNKLLGKEKRPGQYYQDAIADRKLAEKARIKVENISGPVMLISGQEDAYWPSSYFTKEIEDALVKARHPYPVQRLDYPGAGHNFYVPYLPATLQKPGGGNIQDNVYAARDSWKAIRNFVHELLAGYGKGRAAG